MTEPVIKTIIFDLSEVILQGLMGVEKILANEINLDEKIIWESLQGSHFFSLMEGRITEENFWRKTITNLLSMGYTGKELPIDLFKAAIRRNFIPLDGTSEIVAKLGRQPYKLVLLSDHAKEWINWIEKAYTVMSMFDYRCYSFQSECTKLNPDSFNFACQKSKSDPKTSLFIDDNPDNTKRARQFGIAQTITFQNARQLANELSLLDIKI